MAAVTRFGIEGYGSRRAGSFAGKTPAATAAGGIFHSAIWGGVFRGALVVLLMVLCGCI